MMPQQFKRSIMKTFLKTLVIFCAFTIGLARAEETSNSKSSENLSEYAIQQFEYLLDPKKLNGPKPYTLAFRHWLGILTVIEMDPNVKHMIIEGLNRTAPLHVHEYPLKKYIKDFLVSEIKRIKPFLTYYNITWRSDLKDTNLCTLDIEWREVMSSAIRNCLQENNNAKCRAILRKELQIRDPQALEELDQNIKILLDEAEKALKEDRHKIDDLRKESENSN
jgi:hypothetical protein